MSDKYLALLLDCQRANEKREAEIREAKTWVAGCVAMNERLLKLAVEAVEALEVLADGGAMCLPAVVKMRDDLDAIIAGKHD